MKTMKRFILVWLAIFSLTACNDWLEMDANNVVLEDEMFSTPEGFRLALNGIYRDLSSPDLYGKELTWGLVSMLGQSYNENMLGKYRDVALYSWDNARVQGFTQAVWEKAYYVIANCNNLLQHLETKENTFFLQGEKEKNLISGEVYGIRGLLHFELLRLFTASPTSGYTGLAIPYVTQYPDYKPERMNVADVLSKVEGDLELAKKMLAPLDTILLKEATANTEGRFHGKTVPEEGDFFNFRGTRMNYYGATALLARVYLYGKDVENAYRNAKEVYDLHAKGQFIFTQGVFINGANLPMLHRKRYNELFLAFSNSKNYENYQNELTVPTIFRMKNLDILFSTDPDDYRYTGFFDKTSQRYRVWEKPDASNGYASTNVIPFQGPLCPVIGFSEIYYILCECAIAQGHKSEAVALLSKLRTMRGAKRAIAPAILEEALLDEVILDATKEYLTLGQTFFLYKRLNRDMYNGRVPISMTADKYVAQYPDSERAY